MSQDQQKSAPGREQPTASWSPNDILAVLAEQVWVAVIFLGISLVVTLVGSLMMDKVYRAHAVIQILPDAGQEFRVKQIGQSELRGRHEVEIYYATHVQIMRSRMIRQKVVDRYQALGPGYDDLSAESGVAALAGIISVVPQASTQLMDVYVNHTDPEKAAVIANIFTQVYEESDLDARQASARQAREWLKTEIRSHEEALDASNRALLEFKSDNDLVDVEEALTAMNAQSASLNRAHAELVTEIVILESTLESWRSLQQKGQYVDLAKIMKNDVLDVLADEFARVTTQHASVASEYGPAHPEFQRSEARLKGIEAEIRAEVDRRVTAESKRLEVLTRREQNLANQQEAVKGLSLDKQRRRAKYEAIAANLKRTENLLDALNQRNDEMELSSRTQLANVRLVDAATVPKRPIKPNIPMNLVLATIFGIIGGYGLGFVRQYLDDSIATPLDVTQHLKATFLGIVPVVPTELERPDVHTFLKPHSAIAEAMRSLRSVLDMSHNGEVRRSLIVTSALASEGKTGTSIRLGVAYAQLGKRVLLVDADLRHSRLHKPLLNGERPRRGLSSLLRSADFSDLPIHPTEVPNLSLLPAGRHPSNPNELLSGAVFEGLVAHLTGLYDLVIFDTPPAGTVSDAIAMSKVIDGIVMVVRAGRTSRHIVQQTVQRLWQVDANLLGIVLNGVDINNRSGRYRYYGYGYYYGYGAGYGTQAADAKAIAAGEQSADESDEQAPRP
ncbi:MAG: polysaccharide biosynthesis tyrosine autokinase [Deltaproteobacteria bacterium]|nr:polysaccharide biosynthesis tyrosine autokinase [Deltaproteobacteria bacterium]